MSALFTPTEAPASAPAARSSSLSCAGQAGPGGLSRRDDESARTTSTLFVILIGAMIFANYINYTGVPRRPAHWVTGPAARADHGDPAIVAIYVVLGCVLECISMILLTVPVFYPDRADLGYDLIWFGVIVIVV